MELPDLDVELLQQFYFNYIILDESQVIKNPTSNIAKAVTGTEIQAQACAYRYSN